MVEELKERTEIIEQARKETEAERTKFEGIHDEIEKNLTFYDSIGEPYNLHNMGVWWARIYEIQTPEVFIENLDFDEGYEAEKIKTLPHRCEIVYLQEKAVQVVNPESALDYFLQDIEDIFEPDVKCRQTVIHYSSDRKVAAVYVTARQTDGYDNNVYTFVIVCTR